MLILRCHFSFCQSDESFYAAVLNRFWIGEKPIQDEWNSALFYSPLLLPFYGIHIFLNGSTEGVLLFLRVLYVLFSFIAALKLFSLIKRDTSDHLCALVAASIILLFSRANISGISYYNLCMLCGISGFCSAGLAIGYPVRFRTGRLIWAGILLACGVLCDPFLAPILIAMMLYSICAGKRKKALLTVSAGIFTMAILYCIYLIATTGTHEIIANLPFLLNNPEQSSISENLWSALREGAQLSKYVAIPSLIMTATLIWSMYRKVCTDKIYPFYMITQAVLLAITAIHTVNGICGAILLPMTVASFPFCILARQRRRDLLARQLYWFGLLNAAAYAAASNTGIDAGVVGFCMSSIAGLWLCRNSAEECQMSKARIKDLVIALALLICAPMFCQRMIGVYRDAPLWELKAQLHQGPGKGLYTTEEHAKQYEAICDALSDLSEQYPEGRILYAKNLPWAYLMTEYGYGTSSPWRIHTEDIETYYNVHPENRADYICIFSESVGGWEKSPFNRNPGVSTPNAFDYEGEFWDIVQHSPVLLQTEELCVYDVRDGLKEGLLP